MSHNSEASFAEQPAPFTPPALEELERMLPQFAITGLIAHGGMGAVYSGIQRDLERPVAIKVLPPELGRDKESAERFRTEARAMARLTHPHIPTVFEFAVVEDHCVLVMELVEGPNLYTMIRQGQVVPAQALEILSQVCEAVQFAHTRGIIHGDIKPGNILLNADGQVKLADFGLARLVGTGDRGPEGWTTMGTPEYAAPELYDKHAVPDYRADIYSIGVVLHEMLTGAPPAGEFELPGEGLGLDPRVDEIIAKCMEMSPEARYQSASDVRAVLREIIEKRNVPVPPAAKAPTRKITRAGRRAPVIVKARTSAPAGAAPATSRNAPPAAVRQTGGRRPGGKRRVRKVVVAGGGGSGLSEEARRALLIGAAVAVIAIAAWILLSGGSKPEPAETKEVSPAEGASSSGAGSSSGNLPSGGPGLVVSASPPPSPRPPEREKETPPPARSQPTKFTEKFAPVKSAWRDEWNKKVEALFQPEFERTGQLYLSALQKLEDASLGKGETASVIAVRNERQRWNTAGTAPAAAEISSLGELAKLQQQLGTQIDRLRESVAYDANQVKEKYLLALRTLERQLEEDDGDQEGAKLAAEEFEKVTALDDRGLNVYFNAP